MDNDFFREEPKAVIDEFSNEETNIVNFSDKFVTENIDKNRKELIVSNEYCEKTKEIGKASLDVSIDKQSLNVEEGEIDNAIIKHKIAIKKRELDIAAKHDFKRLDFEKEIERKISDREQRAKNKQSKLIKFQDIKAECKIKTDNLFVLKVIAFLVATGDFFKGLSYTFSCFNKFLKSIIIITVVTAIAVGLWYGLDLGKFIKFSSPN